METFEKLLAAYQLFWKYWSSTFFSQFFWQLYFENINFLTKTKKCLLCWILWVQNYQVTGKYLTSNTAFSKKVNPMKYRIQTNILVRTWNLFIHVFYWCIHEIRTMKSIKCKKTSNLITVISSYNICSGVKSQQVKKPFVIKYQKLLIFFRIPPFHLIKLFSTIQFHVFS